MYFIEQAIENCYMTQKYENPGMENGMCAGLRTMHGGGEPSGKCKECRLYYGYAEEHDIKKTNADRIRSMSDEELAKEIAEKIECMNCPFVNEEGKCGEVECDELFLEWIQSEAEE